VGALAVGTLAVGALLSACGGGAAPVRGPAMMGAGSGYHYSRLSCDAPASSRDRTVQVMVADLGMTRMMGGTAPLGARMRMVAAPGTVPAGPVTLVVSNMGWRTHEVVVLPLAHDAAAGQRVASPDGEIDERGSLGEVSNPCAQGAGGGLLSGTIGWTTLTLAPGRYELVCNLPNHYANGMDAELDVT
jgi:uncharacterized cupredoxin-like copper-binding protein